MKKRVSISLITISLLSFILVSVTPGLVFSGPAKTEDPEQDVIVEKTVQYLKDRGVNASDDRIKTIAKSVYEESARYDLDYRLILAVMKVESNYKNEAVSNRGARGLLQVKPALARHIAQDVGVQVKNENCLHEPEKNIKIGVGYLSKLVSMFENLSAALHAYNAGPAKVKKTAEPHTTAFTRTVMREYERITEVLPDSEDQ